MIKVYDRKNKTLINEEQYGASPLNYLYTKKIGRILLKIAINPFFSKIYGFYQKSTLSKNKVNNFIKKYNINLNLYKNKDYKSFNDFFTRELKDKNIKVKESNFISPAESKVLVYKITKDLKVNIKNSTYTLEELIKSDVDESFINGNCFIFRLSVNNYHRYCYVDSGKTLSHKRIKGRLHTVSSISKDYEIYKENKRVVNYLNTNNFSDIIYIEVGALLVGDIINHNKPSYKKGEEKGYFSIGGSTIIILTKDNIEVDKDILEYSKKGIEVMVNYGERIGEKR